MHIFGYMRSNVIQRKLEFTFINFTPIIFSRYFSSKKLFLEKYEFGNVKDLNANDSKNDLKSKNNKEIIYSSLYQSYDYIPPKIKKKFLKTISNEIKESYNIPIILEKYIAKDLINTNKSSDDTTEDQNEHMRFPFAHFEKVSPANSDEFISLPPDNENEEEFKERYSIRDDILYRYRTYKERQKAKLKKGSKEDNVENENNPLYGDSLITKLSEGTLSNRPQYGSPDPSASPSTVPCGGCGANLHCQNENMPGYIPSELFKNKNRGELRSSLCQRCFFLKTYDVALNVRISPEVYEQSLQPITKDKALIIVVADIVDVPCSIWPGLFNLLDPRQPVIVVGNKIDLLPPDSPNHLKNILKSFINVINATNISQRNIKHVALTSAKTGYGIEDLISRIQVLWGTNGNIYIVGCTNSGKSTLFNAFLSSDMCQSNAADLIQRATASPWPGTTLNLLKFPLLKPTGGRIVRRNRRLKKEKMKLKEELYTIPKEGLTTDYTEATLKGHIGRTFKHDGEIKESPNPFAIEPNRHVHYHLGIKDTSYHYLQSKWLFDTPGTVQPDQMLSLLTHDELLQVMPIAMIEPKSFSLKPGQSLFIGGLARLDVLYLSGKSARLTVFASPDLPITIVQTVNASSVYRNYLGSDLFGVPFGNQSRLSRWPCLKPRNIALMNKDSQDESIADIVLSSAGFVAVTGDEEMDFRAWTPGGRGVYVRDPPMLPSAVKLRGKRIKGTSAYQKHRVYIPSPRVIIMDD